MRSAALSLGLVVAGILFPFWPLCAAGVVAAALSGRRLLSLCMGLFLDVVWGVPPSGLLHTVWAPMTALAVLSIALSLWGGEVLLDRSLPERL